MKKILSVLILAITVAIGCSSKKTGSIASETDKALEFEYTAITRGSYRKATVTPNAVYLITEPSGQPAVKKITAADWNALAAIYEKDIIQNGINLSTLEAPSKKHQFDGAFSATLTIRSGNEVTTPTFDHGNPPAQIKALVDEIVKVSGMEAKR